jgi:hypothetical protein
MRVHDIHLTGLRNAARAAIIAVAVIAATCIAVVPGEAHAGETESHSLFVEGRELRKNGKCAEAITAFRRALDTYPEGLGALRNVAECEEELGRFASARRSYWDLRLAALQSPETKYAGWDKEAEEAHTRLAAKVAKVTVSFKGTRPDDLVIQFNGRTFDPRLLGVEIEQDNGPLEVAASYGAGPPVTKKVVVATAGRHAIEFDVSELKKGKTTTPPGGERGSSDAMKIGGIVALGIGGAGLVGTGVAIAMRQSALSDLETDCPDYETQTCPARTADIKDRGTTAALLTNIFAATAIVGAGVGVTLLVLAPSDDPETGQAPPRPRARVAVTPLPGGGFFGVSGSM